MSNWENIIKITSWTPSCPQCGTPMEKTKTNKNNWRQIRDRAVFVCPACGHKEVF